jgi:Amt family ammonium transporter
MLPEQGGSSVGTTAWLLVCAAFVLLMTPGVAFFYGGMVRARNVLGTLMQSFIAIGIVSVAWVAVGFSLVFDRGNPLIGGLSFAGLTDLTLSVPGIDLDGAPLLAFVAFQLMFAVITPALITGAGGERWRFGGFVFFVTLWSVLVYAPVAHWLFSPHGWAHDLGAYDFAGGAVVHANAGAAAIVVAARLGQRRGWPDPSMRPHNLPLMLTGATLLWFGWFGFNAGSALRADGIAALAVVNTQVAAGSALIAWALAERIRFGKATSLGAASGAIAGLVAITPAAGYVTPLGAIAVGAGAGMLCHLMVGLKSIFRFDDALDVAAVHLGGGLVGTLAVGLLASSTVNPSVPNGLFYGGGYRLLGAQAVALVAVIAYSMLMTLIIMVLGGRLIGARLTTREETIGLDLSQHGEIAYGLADPPPDRVTPAAAAPAAGNGVATTPAHARVGS